MKRFLLLVLLVLSFSIDASSSFDRKIEKLVGPYEKAVEFLVNLNSSLQVDDKITSEFFNAFGLYRKNDKKRFESSLKSLKKLLYKKNSNQDQKDFVESKIVGMKKVQNFIAEYATTYYAHIVYNEIEAVYHYINEQNDDVIDTIIDKPWLLDLSIANNRGLYHFVKKIDLDERRLAALLTQRNVSIDIAVKVDQLITKITILKHKIIQTPEYKKQQSKTRWLKACGIVFVPMLLFVPFILVCAAIAPVSMVITVPAMIILAPIYGLLGACTWAAVITTIQDVQEAQKYDIPMHARSLFSLVGWQGWVIFLATRLPYVLVV